MRFGVHIGPQNCTIDDLRRLWMWADRGRLHWFSVWDHIYAKTDDSAPHFEAIALMAAAAVETREIQLGCLVFCAAFRNPGLLAKSMVTIDHLSGGRANVGLGAGWHQPEYRAYGYDFGAPRERLDLLEENAAAVRGLLRQETTDLDGRYVHLDHACANPKPVGRLPLWIGGLGEKRTLRIAARYADGWNAAYIGPEDFRHKSEVLDRWCDREGRDPARIERSLNLFFYMGANEAAVPATEARMREQLEGDADTRRGGALTGNPRQAVERIGAYRDAGVDWINVAIRPPIDWEALQAYLEEVVPAFA